MNDYVNYEAAKAMHGIGFNVSTQKGFAVKTGIISRPVLQKALEWLRQEHKVSLRINWSFAYEGWFFDFLDIEDNSYLDSTSYYQNYNEAVNAGIIRMCEYIRENKI